MNKILKVLLLLFLVVYLSAFFSTKTESKEINSSNAGVAKIISNDLLNNEDNKIEYTEYEVPENNGFKSFMLHTSITDKSSKQYDLQNNYAYTDESGLRKVDGRYCIAIGTAFNSEIGDYADLILDNGEVICAIISDIKADIHTDSNNIATRSNGCVSEFIVDNNLNKYVKKHGDISYHKEEWDSPVIKIKIYNQNIFNFKEETKWEQKLQ